MVFTTKSLAALPTLCTAQCCSLKREANGYRVWLCRVNGGITVEAYDEQMGRWNIEEGSCNFKGPVYL